MGVCDSIKKPIIPQAAILHRPVCIEEIEELETYCGPAICKIKNNGKSSSDTGFFCELDDEDIDFKKALFTNNHILDETKLEINKEIEFEYLNEFKKVELKKIKITKNRRTFTNKNLDYTCIEILDSDNINNFFKIDKIFFQSKNTLVEEEDKEIEEVFILQYKENGKLSHSNGRITDIENDLIKYSTSTSVFSSGSPLIKRYNISYILGIHIGEEKNKSIENGFKYFALPFNRIINDIKDIMDINIKPPKFVEYRNIINLIYDKKDKYNERSNKIFSELFVKNNQNNIKLKINSKEYPLMYEYELKEGINNIQLVIINKLKNLEGMFGYCVSLKNINELKFLNTDDVNNFKSIFYGCTSLSDIKGLQNWNVSKGKDFSYMFKGCSSLSNLKGLENWDVSNGKIFDNMFSNCSSLSDINSLKNWDVSNGNSFYLMFSGCSSLSNLKGLKNWNVSNGNNFYAMFEECSSLTNLKGLEKWNVSNGKDFSSMFYKCTLLSNIEALTNWNVSKAETFEYMFMECSSLTNLKGLENWNVSNVDVFNFMFHSCSLLSDINALANWDVSNAEWFLSMFGECNSLTDAAVVSRWIFSDASKINTLFG